MKNENITSDKLDDYFALARDMQPVAGVEEMERKIMAARAGSGKSFFHTSKFKIVMSTSIIIIAAYIAGLFLNNGKTSFNEEKSDKHIKKQVITVQRVIPVNDNTSKIYSKNFGSLKNVEHLGLIEPPVLSRPSARSDEIFNFHNPAVQLTPITIPPKLPLTSSDGKGEAIKSGKPFALPDTKPLELDKKHLEALGFMVSTWGIVYERGIIYTTQVKGLGSIWYSNNKNGADLKINSKDIPVSKNRDYYPVYISETRDGEPMNIDSILRKQSKFEATDTSAYWKLVPVLIKQSDYHGFEGKQDLVFWFKATPSFLEAIKDVHVGVSVVLISKPGKTIDEEVLLTSKYVEKEHLDTFLELKAIRPLQLDSLQMTKLGFIYGLESLQYKCTISGHGTIYFFNTRHQFGLDTYAPMVFTGKGEDIYPVIISDVNGFQELKYKFNDFEDKSKWTDSYFLSTIRSLVPVLVKQEGKGFAEKKDLIFWFKVTPSFLAALPDSISKEMGSEYNSLERTMKEMSKRMKELKRNNKTDINSNDTNTNIVTCKYFDVCQLPLEKELKVNIYPNPAQLILNVDFELNANTTANLYMCDLGGKIVKTFDQPYSGVQHIQIQTGDLKSGIYLVILKLNNGAVLTNKVMISSNN